MPVGADRVVHDAQAKERAPDTHVAKGTSVPSAPYRSTLEEMLAEPRNATAESAEPNAAKTAPGTASRTPMETSRR